MSDITVSEMIAREQYQKALKLIEQAQNKLTEACQQLSPLIGACGQWEDCGRMQTEVHELWRRLAYDMARENVKMDYDVEECDPTPWCSGCRAMTRKKCSCGPIADND